MYAEKQKRVQELKELGESKAAEVTTGKVTAGLENLYDNVGIPQETPSRQELLKRAGSMQGEELEVFGNELIRITAEYNRTQDQKALDAALSDLATRKFTKAEVVDKRKQATQSKLEAVRKSLGINPEQSQKVEGKESPEARLQKYKAYEGHKSSVERVVKSLQEARNNLEKSNNISSALTMFEGTISMLTQSANSEDIEKLKGQPIDLEKEKRMFGIEDSALDEYIQMRGAQNALGEGRSVKEVLDTMEKGLSDKYGISKTETEKAKTLKDLDALKIAGNITAESTDDPGLVGSNKRG